MRSRLLPSRLWSAGLGIFVLIPILAHAQSPSTFRLPPGNAEAGRQAFADMKCVQCHGVKGITFDHPDLYKRLELVLAGSPRFVTNYQTLVTAITNPRHVIQKQYGELLSSLDRDETDPFMPDFTGAMTVRQLIDIVAFLEGQYRNEAANFQSN